VKTELFEKNKTKQSPKAKNRKPKKRRKAPKENRFAVKKMWEY